MVFEIWREFLINYDQRIYHPIYSPCFIAHFVFTTMLQSKLNGHNSHGPVVFSSIEETTKLETRSSKKVKYNVEPFIVETEIKITKNTLKRRMQCRGNFLIHNR